MKIVINDCYGGFGLSEFALKELGLEYSWDIDRTNAKLIDLIEQYGASACQGDLSQLSIVDIPDDATDWRINDYDGVESITYVLGGKLYDVS